MKKNLYVKRILLNYDSIRSWAEDQGFENILTDGDMHVTIARSSATIEWDQFEPQTRNLKIIGGERTMKQFGEAAVLAFSSNRLTNRWQEFKDGGASWDFESYIPHVTITHSALPENVVPYDEELVLGQEIFSEIVENWTDNVVEDDL